MASLERFETWGDVPPVPAECAEALLEVMTPSPLVDLTRELCVKALRSSYTGLYTLFRQRSCKRDEVD